MLTNLSFVNLDILIIVNGKMQLNHVLILVNVKDKDEEMK